MGILNPKPKQGPPANPYNSPGQAGAQHAPQMQPHNSSTGHPPPASYVAPTPQQPQMQQQPMQPQAPQQIQQPIPQGQIPRNTNPNSTQNALLIAEIRDGIAIMKDGSFRSVIMSQSINFDLMSPEEREGVEYSYQNFLNSLYFPIQIFVRSKKVDMRPYLEKLLKLKNEQDNMLLGLLMEDYIQFIEILTQETNIMDKQFYVVIPFYLDEKAQIDIENGKRLLTNFLKPKKPQEVIRLNEGDLETAKTELKNRTQSVMAGLAQIGVQSIPLDTKELIELYYDSYNPDTATRQQINNYQDLASDVIVRGRGDAPNPNLDRGIF